MNFTDAIGSMNRAATRNAAKRGQMGGYIWKFGSAEKNGLPALLEDANDYRIALVQRDGDQFIYTYTAATGSFAYNGKVAAASGGALDNTTAPTAGSALEFDAQLFLHIAVGADWTVGNQADFEDSRTGTGDW